jgi:hypothetical protein
MDFSQTGSQILRDRAIVRQEAQKVGDKLRRLAELAHINPVQTPYFERVFDAYGTNDYHETLRKVEQELDEAIKRQEWING